MGASGLFVTFEGMEGVGKSSLMAAVFDGLMSLNIPCEKTHEPGGTDLGDKIRRIFVETEGLSARTETCLVSAARCHHVESKIKPWLSQGKVVLCDRFTDSTYVYQGFMHEVSFSEIESFVEFGSGGCTPDVVFLVDCSVDTAKIRLGTDQTRELSRFDKKGYEYFSKLRLGYLQVADRFAHRTVILNGERATKDLAKDVISYILEKRTDSRG